MGRRIEFLAPQEAAGVMSGIDNSCQSRQSLRMAATMNISLPEALRDFVEEAVSSGGYSSVSEYMRELVRQAKAEKDLEDRLLAALDSADLGPVDPEFFEGLKARAKKATRRG